MPKQKRNPDFDMPDFDMGGFGFDASSLLDLDADSQSDELAEGMVGKIEPDAKTELTALERAFKERKLAEIERFKQNTDSEYWVALCFPSREAKTEFLEQAGLIADGDKYLDGMKAAQLLGIEMSQPKIAFSTTFKTNRGLADLT